jgi:hypothetical protein
MGFFDVLGKLLNFPLGGLVILIIGIIVFLIAFSVLLSRIRQI